MAMEIPHLPPPYPPLGMEITAEEKQQDGEKDGGNYSPFDSFCSV